MEDPMEEDNEQRCDISRDAIEVEIASAGVDQRSSDERYEIAVANDDFLRAELPQSYRSHFLSASSSESRLVITKIESENFKSYAGKHLLGRIHPNFSCVVGPNGSGKSNVIDSLLFVFGYRAQKIRSKKLNVLIHSSSERGKFSFCTVQVHFAKIGANCADPSVDYPIIPGSEFCISRTAYEDSTSVYCINNRRVHYSDVATLLKNVGIDIDHNRFLIQQGEVEAIAMMKPVSVDGHEPGLLEYLEDIIGSSRLKATVSMLHGKVDELFDVKAERIMRLEFANSEMKNVEEAKNEAVFYLRVDNTLTRARHFAKRAKLHHANEELTKKNEEISVAKGELNSLNDNIKRNKDSLESFATECAGLKRRKSKLAAEEQRIKLKVKEIEDGKEKMSKEIANLQNRLPELRDSIASTENEITRLKEEREEKMAEQEQPRKRVDEFKAEADELNAKLDAATKALAAETADIHKDLDDVEDQLNRRKPKENAILAKINAAKNKLSELTWHRGKESSNAENKKEVLKSAKEEIEVERQKLTTLEGQVEERGRTLQEIRNELDLAHERERRADTKFRETESKFLEVKHAYQDLKYPNQTLNALLEEGRSGRISGIVGRLGDFGSVDPKYDVAFCTACRGLDNVVVDTLDTGTKCVNYLKQANKGRATFTCLDKVKRWENEMKRPFSAPRGAKRLFDLLRVEDPTLLTAFYGAITDTLLAEDLTDARRIAFHSGQRWRVVTMKGELIEKSGVMAGGGVARGGKLGRHGKALDPKLSNISANDVSSMEKRVQGMRDELAKIACQKQALEDKLEQAEKDLRETVLQRDLQRKTIENLCQRQHDLEKDIKEGERSQKSSDDLEREIKAIEKDIELFEKEREKFLSEQSSLREKMERLQDQLRDKANKAIGWVQSRLKDCKEDMKKDSDFLRDLERAVKKIDRAIFNCASKVKSAKESLVEAESQLVKLEEKIQTNEERMSTLLVKLEELTPEIEAILPRMKELDEAISELEEKLQTLNAELIDRNNSFKTVEDEEKRLVAIVSQLQAEVENFKLHDLSDLKPFELPNKPPSSNLNIQISEFDDYLFFEGDSVDSLVAPSVEAIENLNMEQLKEVIKQLKGLRGSLSPDLRAIDEYRKRATVYQKFFNQVNTVTDLHQRAVDRYNEVSRLRHEEFILGFETIAIKLKEIYRLLTMGGDADLEFVDVANPFTEGIYFSVRPPKKSWKRICNLSGGEKTLSSLAFIFALHEYRPSPFYVMDEIDAALDFHNVDIIGNYLSKLTNRAQFVVVSLRCELFEKAPFLIGIYKINNCTIIQTLDVPVFLEMVQLAHNAAGQENAPSPEDLNNEGLNAQRPN
uniref:Structural maintenance of chromosomes protein n=1 Tax=Trichuris muris TaxID=70415 RepID=A0A5S6QIL6_TRIMR